MCLLVVGWGGRQLAGPFPHTQGISMSPAPGEKPLHSYRARINQAKVHSMGTNGFLPPDQRSHGNPKSFVGTKTSALFPEQHFPLERQRPAPHEAQRRVPLFARRLHISLASRQPPSAPLRDLQSHAGGLPPPAAPGSPAPVHLRRPGLTAHSEA